MKKGDLVKKDLTGNKGIILKVFKRQAEILVKWSEKLFTIEKISNVSTEKESIIEKHY